MDEVKYRIGNIHYERHHRIYGNIEKSLVWMVG
jgi:hypothetical protein